MAKVENLEIMKADLSKNHHNDLMVALVDLYAKE